MAKALAPQLTVAQASQVFKMLADDSRLRVLALLAHNEELSVLSLIGETGQSQPAVSHHLSLLRLAKLVRYRRDGQNNFYRLDSAVVRALLKVIKF